MDFQREMKNKQDGINDILKKFMPEEDDDSFTPQKKLYKAMNYSLQAGGKRLRPMLMEESFIFLGGKGRRILEPFMAAIELIHTYSLVHDDLPAIDNDEYRRGMKTTHIVYGEAMGILAGDALLNYAFEVAASAFDYAKDADEMKRVAKAMQLLTKKPGIHGMIGGQVVDVETVGKPASFKILDFIYRMKTSALIECSLMIGALLAGADEATILEMESIGRDVGIAFQIQDDILDMTGSFETLGKPIHSDEKNNKTTYAALLGLVKSKKDVQSLSDAALNKLKNIKKHGENPFLPMLIEKLVYRDT